MRGYGRTSAPPRVEDYDIVNLVNDMTGLLDALDIERAAFIGHDWGAIVTWHLSIMAPERVAAVAGLGVPFMPRSPEPLTTTVQAAAPDNFHYLTYFQEVGPADRELDRDPRRTLSRVTSPPGSFESLPRDGVGMLHGLPEHLPKPDWYTDEQFDAVVAEYERTGFTPGLNWYRNIKRNWELTEHLSDARVAAPAMFIAGQNDPARHFGPVDDMEKWVPNLRKKVILADTGHWTQQERPDEVNELILQFLNDVPRGQELQGWYKWPHDFDVCAGQHGSVSQYYDV
jgi:epoxide hydrolase A/B